MPLGSVSLKPHARPIYFSYYLRVSKWKLTSFSTRESNLLRPAVEISFQFIHLMMALSRLVALRDENIFFFSTTAMTPTRSRPQVGSDIIESRFWFEGKDLLAGKDLVANKDLNEVKDSVELNDVKAGARDRVKCGLYSSRSHAWVMCSPWLVGPVIMALQWLFFLGTSSVEWIVVAINSLVKKPSNLVGNWRRKLVESIDEKPSNPDSKLRRKTKRSL